jgi:hypothetical protein
MSALPPKADIAERDRVHQIADIAMSAEIRRLIVSK